MKIRFTKSFENRLLNQIDFIANDSPSRAKKFQIDLINLIKRISKSPRSYRKSRYFEDNSVRDLIFKGYTIVFKINEDVIDVFGFIKHQESIED